ncbi:hypothetical protein [Streptomyces sp. NPDC057336]|uniref:hypothetical protein n=1 Tax=Streptomyces sp. NPDC057336 TaxID=3346102 RepID=UPI0036337C2E
MTIRHTVDSITSDALDALYDQLDAAKRERREAAQLSHRYRNDAERAEAAIARVRALHRRNEHTGDCEPCSASDYPDYAVPHPCPTIRALDDQQPAPAPAATQATDDEHLGGSPAKPGVPRCTAAWQIPDNGRLATCWRPATHNSAPGYETHMGETEQGFRYQWIGTEPGATPHRITALPVDPEAERAATERAVQAAVANERSTEWITRRSAPREHCGHLSPDTGLTTVRTECVLQPGHQGSHADDVGCRWCYDPTGGNHTSPSRVVHTTSATPPTENP